MLETTPPSTESRLYAKWGEAAVAGWQGLPDVLLKNQHKLDLTPTELVVLINVLSFWWYVEELPFPRISTLAKRMNVTDRTVQRCLKKLAQKGLLKRKTDIGKDGEMREVLDPEGLVAALKKLAVHDPAFRHRQGSKRAMEEALEAEIPF